MRYRVYTMCAAVALGLALAPVAHTRAQQKGAPVSVTRSGTAAQLETEEGDAVVAGVDAWFIWVTIAVSAPQAFDLAKVSFVSGDVPFPLAGVGLAADGREQSQFSMIVPARGRSGTLHDPRAAARSQDGVAFTFTPGNTPEATLRISGTPREFSLAFLVPSAVRAGMVKGLGAADVGVAVREPDVWFPADSVAIDGRPIPAVNVPAAPRRVNWRTWAARAQLISWATPMRSPSGPRI